MGEDLNTGDSQKGDFFDVARYKVEQAKDDLDSAKLLLNAGKYKAANNRAYYACFHAVDAVLAMERMAFKKHKDTILHLRRKQRNKLILLFM